MGIQVDGKLVSRSFVGINTGYQIASHLHELIRLEPGQIVQVIFSIISESFSSFVCLSPCRTNSISQVYQQMNGNNLTGTVDNTLAIHLFVNNSW